MAEKAKALKSVPTEYVVLEQFPANEGDKGVKHMNGDDIDGPFVYLPVGETTGSGTEKALIERWAEGQGTTGAFKLVPARSWKGGIRIFERTAVTSAPLEDG